jgi:hypothetical protein
MYANQQSHPQFQTGGMIDPRMPSAVAPRRTEVDRLNGAIERLEKTMVEHVDRIDPILRPSGPCIATTAGMTSYPGSRLASLVARVEDACDRLGRITERVEA